MCNFKVKPLLYMLSVFSPHNYVLILRLGCSFKNLFTAFQQCDKVVQRASLRNVLDSERFWEKLRKICF